MMPRNFTKDCVVLTSRGSERIGLLEDRILMGAVTAKVEANHTAIKNIKRTGREIRNTTLQT